MKPDLPPKRNLPLRRSFFCAFTGIGIAYGRERNFRIHLGAALVALYLGYCFSLSRAEWAGLILTIAAVLICELFNSAVEHLVDYAAGGEEHPLAGAVKDIAAGAVLVSSAAAVCVGIALFWDPAKLLQFLRAFPDRPLPFLLVLAAATLVARLPDRIRRTKQEDEERELGNKK